VTDRTDVDATRRTMLAAERTWLAWWRSGIAAAATSVAVGGVVPQLIGGARTPYVLLGSGYALLALTLFVGAWLRQRQVETALERGGYAAVPAGWVLALTFAAAVLALATLLVIVIES
jgi:putative membrane protein